MNVPEKVERLDTQTLYEKLFASSPDAILVQRGLVVLERPKPAALPEVDSHSCQ